MTVLTVLWLAAIYHWLRPESTTIRYVAACCMAAVMLLNLKNFHRVNELVRIMHTYPLAQIKPRIYERELLARKYEALLNAGPLPQAEGLRTQFAYYREYPMGTDDYADRLEGTFRKSRR